VISNPAQKLFRSPVKRFRLLAVLLLASIAWGSTAELTHHHSAGTRVGGSISTAQSTAQSTVPGEATSNQVSASKTNGSTSNTKGGAECLICQLHQNLSASAIGHTPGDGPTEALRQNTPLSEVVQLAEFASTGHGRAPPSLL
jgi:hypothetical protein